MMTYHPLLPKTRVPSLVTGFHPSSIPSFPSAGVLDKNSKRQNSGSSSDVKAEAEAGSGSAGIGNSFIEMAAEGEVVKVK